MKRFEGEWETKRIGDLIAYKRPDSYIVTSDKYSVHGNIPVLTANKTFILGYTDEASGICYNFPVIVFDDFTTDSKYATFPFKVKSSAIKLLYPKNERVDLRYVFEGMQLIHFPLGNHTRHYIAEYQNLEILLPDYKEQKAIAEVLSNVDGLISSLETLIRKKRYIKQAVMQRLLTGKSRLPGFRGAWETKRLGDIADIKTGRKNNEDKETDGKYPLFVRSAIVERINSYCYDGEAILVPGEGGIENIFHYIKGRFDCHQRVYMINRFDKDICGKLIYYIMVWQFGRHAMQNTVKATVDSLRLPTFTGFSFDIPKDISEQKAIAAVLSDMDAEITALEKRRDKTIGIKQAMLQSLLTGQVRLPILACV